MLTPIKALELARNAYSDSTTYFDASIRNGVESGLRQFQGVHPTSSKYHSEAYKSRARFFRPKTRATIRRNEAVAAEAFFSTNTLATCDAENDGDKLHRASSALMQELLNYRLKKSIPWFQLAMGAYQDAQTVRVCISYQWWEYNPKKKIDRPRIDLIPVENFRIAPGADWLDPINTSPYLIHKIPMFVKDVTAKMKDAGDKSGKATWHTIEPAQLLKAINAYSDSTRLTRERGRTDSKESATSINEFALVWVHRNIVEWEGDDYVYYTLADQELLSDPVPLESVCRIGRRPYVMGYCVLETHKTYPDTVTDITKDSQGEINDLANLRIDNVRFALNKRYFGKRGAQVDLRSLTRNVPGSVTLMNDPEKDIKVVETNDVTGSSYQEQDRLNLDFDDVAGTFSPSTVQSNRRLNETVGGMKLLNANTNQVGAYQLRTFVETWAEPVLEQLGLLERAYETDDVILALCGAKAQLVKRFGIQAITDDLLNMDTAMSISVSGVGNLSPQEQVNNFIRAMEALRGLLQDNVLQRYGLDVGEVIAELFGKLGHKDGKRFFDTGDVDPRLHAAMSTIDELQQQLAQKVSPELVAAQVRKLDAEIESLGAKILDIKATAGEKKGRTVYAAGQTAQMIATVPQLGPLIDAVLALVGYQEPAGAELPAGTQALPGLTQGEVKNPKTGIKFTPGGDGAAAGDTTPNTPANPAVPKTPGTGAEAGIETARADA